MRLDLRSILHVPGASLPFSFALDLSGLDFYGEHPFQQPIHVQGKLENKADVFYLRAQVVAPVDTHCARCGVPVQVQKELEIDLVIASSLSNEEGSDDIYVVEGETFDPYAGCTRAMAVYFMWVAADSPEAAAASFTDVAADADYAAAVNWAVAQGVTLGTGDGSTFSPDTVCQRGQIVTFLYRAANAAA